MIHSHTSNIGPESLREILRGSPGRRVPLTSVAGVCAVLFAACRLAASPVDIVRIDGKRMSCGLEGATASVVRLDCGEPVALAIDDIGSLWFRTGSNASDAMDGAMEFFPAAGGRLRASFAGGDGGETDGQVAESLAVDTALGRDLRISFSTLAGIWFGHEKVEPGGRGVFDDAMAHRLAGQDVLVTQRDGEINTIRGSVVALGPEGGRILLGRKERSFKLHRVLGIAFATGLPSEERWPVGVRTVDGTEFAARLVEGDSSQMRFETSFAGAVTVSVSELSRLTIDSDRVVWLSDLTPTGEEFAGRLHEGSPARKDRSASNGPLMVDGRVFEKGMGVHSYSLLAYDLSGAYETLVAVVGIDDAVRPRGSVVFRVEGDGRGLFDSGSLTGRDKWKEILVDVSGVSTLRLIVDYDTDMDLSDHADWGDARLIRPREKTSPP